MSSTTASPLARDAQRHGVVTTTSSPSPAPAPIATSAPTPGLATTANDDITSSEPPPAYTSSDPTHTIKTEQHGLMTTYQPTPRPENYVVNLEDLEEEPDFIDCPYCQSRRKTVVYHQPSNQTLITVVLCCFFGILPAIFPICCNWCAEIDHKCSHCNKFVAHQPYNGKMEPVLPNRPKERYKPSQYQPPTGPNAGTELDSSLYPPPAAAATAAAAPASDSNPNAVSGNAGSQMQPQGSQQ